MGLKSGTNETGTQSWIEMSRSQKGGKFLLLMTKGAIKFSCNTPNPLVKHYETGSFSFYNNDFNIP